MTEFLQAHRNPKQIPTTSQESVLKSLSLYDTPFPRYSGRKFVFSDGKLHKGTLGSSSPEQPNFGRQNFISQVAR